MKLKTIIQTENLKKTGKTKVEKRQVGLIKIFVQKGQKEVIEERRVGKKIKQMNRKTKRQKDSETEMQNDRKPFTMTEK